MDSSNTKISLCNGFSYNESIAFSPTLNPNAPMFFPNNPFPYGYYYSPPPVYLLPPPPPPPPPPSIFVYYPLWYVNPNPNRFEFIQERPPLYPPSPSIMVRRRRKIKLQDDDHMTTVMLRNIPNNYTREMMIEFMDKHCEEANKMEKDEAYPISAYDFFYLPIDFKTRMNRGYAFVNFINKEAVWKFEAACKHKPWPYFLSRKLLEIDYAMIQGKDQLVKHFEQMTYPTEAYSAVCFSPARSGPKNTVQTIMVGECTDPMI